MAFPWFGQRLPPIKINKCPLKMTLPTIHFQVPNVSFRECSLLIYAGVSWWKKSRKSLGIDQTVIKHVHPHPRKKKCCHPETDLQPNISKQCVMYLSSPQAPKGKEPLHTSEGERQTTSSFGNILLLVYVFGQFKAIQQRFRQYIAWNVAWNPDIGLWWDPYIGIIKIPI